MSSSRGAISPYKLASVLLQYPTTALFDGLNELEAVAQTSPKASRDAFARFLLWLRATPPTEVGQHYVETFDLRRRCALYLSYYRYGDTRKRGMSMLTFKTAYRAAGFDPSDDELPDYLPMVLDFAALTPRGERLLRAHRADLELLRRALEQASTPYLDVVAAVCALLPRLGRREAGLVHAAWESRPATRGGRTRAVCPAGIPDRLRNPDVTATAAQVFWWVALPYLALGVFAVGHVWRWRYDQFGWTSRSTQLQERRMLKWGSPLFHYGTFAAIGGHVIGVLIPERWTQAIGIPENVYRWFSAGAGTLAAVLVIGGVIVLASRRLLVPRVRATTAPINYVTLILLLIVILTGIAPTIGINLLGHGYNYRTTVAPWFRSLFTGSPDVQAIAHAPFIYQLHATAAWMIWALWPFSRLVHAWSYPLWYLWRPYIVYRSRRPAPPSEPGTGGRKWRKIGAPY